MATSEVPVTPDDFQWLNDPQRWPAANAATITLATYPQTKREVLHILRADADRATETDDWTTSDVATASVRDDEKGLIVVEDNGWRATEPGYSEKLSNHGQVAVLFWNVNMNIQLILAAHGQRLVSVDPFALDQRVGTRPQLVEDLFPEAADASFWAGKRLGACAALAVRFTGITISPLKLAVTLETKYPLREI